MKEFATFNDFAGFLSGAAAAMAEGERVGLERAARIVEAEAKREIGTYQDAVGDLPAWAQLANATKADRLRKGFTENDPGRRSGAMADSIGHVVEGREAVVGSDSEDLVFFELGTAKQPPRSVLAGAAIRKEHEAVDAMAAGALAPLFGVINR